MREERREQAAPGVPFLFVPFLWASKEKGPAVRRKLREIQQGIIDKK